LKTNGKGWRRRTRQHRMRPLRGLRQQWAPDLLVVCGTGLCSSQSRRRVVSYQARCFQICKASARHFHPRRGCRLRCDGRLDIYFCMYMYYLGLDQYHYPIPYFDARNGPPNCLFHNEGNGTFVETTEATGMRADNDRYSFSCAWGDSNSTDFPISSCQRLSAVLSFIATTETELSPSHRAKPMVEEVGAGMGCSWLRLRQ